MAQLLISRFDSIGCQREAASVHALCACIRYTKLRGAYSYLICYVNIAYIQIDDCCSIIRYYPVLLMPGSFVLYIAQFSEQLWEGWVIDPFQPPV
jgi:hypothetical protein